jgi:glycosyltransferase involved in cell wall biosynthesis
MDSPSSNPPVITGIIIFLNGEKHLAEAIDSVLAQTFTRWELLLCDDGSTDGATAIAKDYAARFPDRIRYLEHPNHENRGMSATRNLGIRHARGEYIAMLDADDVWTAVKLEEQLAILEANPRAAMVYGPMKQWYSWTGKPQDDRRDAMQKLGVTPDRIVEAPELLLSFLRDPACHVCGLLTRKSVLQEVGCYEEEFRTEYEDVIVQSKISLRYPAYSSSRCWYWYRQHDDSCTSQTRRHCQQRPARLKFLRKLEGHLASLGVTSGEVWNEVQRQLRPFNRRFAYSIERAAMQAAVAVRDIAKRVMPKPIVAWARAKYWRHGYTPPAGWVRYGSLRRTAPISRDFGVERGTPVDAYYADRFLTEHRADLRGAVLEVGDRPGTGHRFAARDVTRFATASLRLDARLNCEAGDHALLDLRDGPFDCVLLGGALAHAFDTRAALRACFDALCPGGVLLATLPCISQINRYADVRQGDYWRFTPRSARALFEQVVRSDQLDVRIYGNVLAATALLQGIAAEELRADELDANDVEFPVVVAVRAVKPANDVALHSFAHASTKGAN